MYKNVHINFIHNSPKCKQSPCSSIGGWITFINRRWINKCLSTGEWINKCIPTQMFDKHHFHGQMYPPAKWETWLPLDPRVGKIPWRRGRLLTPAFWPEEFNGLYTHEVTKGQTRLSSFTSLHSHTRHWDMIPMGPLCFHTSYEERHWLAPDNLLKKTLAQ